MLLDKMHKRGFLFDLDGTLVNTAPDFSAVMNGIRAEQALPPISTQELPGLVNAGATAMTCAAYQTKDSDAGFSGQKTVFLDRYMASIGHFSHMYPPLDALIETIEKADIAWGIVTNKPRRFAEIVLERLALTPTVLVCGDDVNQSKPHPEGLLIAARALAIPSHQLGYCGDHLRDIQAGNAANMYTIAASYGYLAANDEAACWQASATAHTPTQLAELIQAFLKI